MHFHCTPRSNWPFLCNLVLIFRRSNHLLCKIQGRESVLFFTHQPSATLHFIFYRVNDTSNQNGPCLVLTNPHCLVKVSTQFYISFDYLPSKHANLSSQCYTYTLGFKVLTLRMNPAFSHPSVYFEYTLKKKTPLNKIPIIV